MELTAAMQALYENEINCSIHSFWDGGFTVRIGDELNGWKDEMSFDAKDLQSAAVWLTRAANRLYSGGAAESAQPATESATKNLSEDKHVQKLFDNYWAARKALELKRKEILPLGALIQSQIDYDSSATVIAHPVDVTEVDLLNGPRIHWQHVEIISPTNNKENGV